MYVLFEDAGRFYAGRVMSDADSSTQVELDSGKRVRVKAANLLLRFEQPAPAELFAQAQALAAGIDLDLAWEFAPAEEFGFADLARDYFDAKAGVAQQAAALFRLFEAPHYFRRLGRGNFRKAPEEIVKAALLGIERKKQVAAQVDAWAAELVSGGCPAPVREQLYKILFKPDKNAAEYKAVVEAARRAQRAPLDLLKAAGAIVSPYQFHWKRFLFENFPHGTALPALAAPPGMDTLPLAAVRAFSIDDSATTESDDALSVQHTETRIERVPIAANLRHDQLDSVFTEAALTGAEACAHEFAAEMTLLFRLARTLKAQREQVRGKPETFNRSDYNFRLEGGSGSEPRGDERVVISTRQRGAPLDLIVAEAMILANSTWGGWLAACGVPGIYRSQASLLPGIKVRMGTRAAPHAGLGVAQYSWATSPLRRYVDLVNQWQIVACVRHGRTAALAAPFKPRDTALMAVVSAFDAAYAAYNDFQATIERYWTLIHLAQAGIGELEADVLRDGLVRATALPLVFRALGAEGLARGTRVRVRIGACDLLTLDVHASVAARLADSAAAAVDEAADEELVAAGPLTLAIDMQDAAESAAEPAVAPAAAPAARGRR